MQFLLLFIPIYEFLDTDLDCSEEPNNTNKVEPTITEKILGNSVFKNFLNLGLDLLCVQCCYRF